MSQHGTPCCDLTPLNHARTDGDTLLNLTLSCAKAGVQIARATSPARNIIDFVTALARQRPVVLALSLMAHQIRFLSQQGDLMDVGCWSRNQRRRKILVSDTRAPAGRSGPQVPRQTHGKTQLAPAGNCSLLCVFDKV